MKRWLWIFVSILISTGVYFTIRYGLRPKPIPVLNATEFEQLPQIGAVVFKRLRQEVRGERVVVLGSSIELQDYADVWTGFLKTALAEPLKIDVFFQREGMVNPMPPGQAIETVMYTEAMVQSGELLNLVKARMGAGQLLIIHGPTNEVSHLMKDSVSRGLDTILQRPVLALSTLDLGLTDEAQRSLQGRCMSAENAGQMRIECAEYRVGKVLLKKKIGEGKIWAVMEQHGLKEFLIFVHR